MLVIDKLSVEGLSVGDMIETLLGMLIKGLRQPYPNQPNAARTRKSPAG